jgi:hypothetical protein
MSRALGVVLALVGMGAVGALYLELRPPPHAEPLPLEPPHIARKAPPLPDGGGADRLATILARPLFNPSRRPTAAAANAQPGFDLPRLAGIVIDQSGRSVIFALADRAKALVLREGGTFGEWSVRSIDKTAVTLTGPAGTRVLHLSFEKPARPGVHGHHQPLLRSLF